MFASYFFDLDGTLCDSLPDLALASNLTRQHYGLSPLSENQIKNYVGDGMKILVQRFLQDQPNVDALQAYHYFVEVYEQNACVQTKLYPEVQETVLALKNKKALLGVITNKNEQLAKMILKELNILEYFDFVYGGDTFPEKKPNPYPLIQAQSAFQAENILMVGDSKNDILAGKNFGCPVAYYSNGYGQIELEKEADFVFNRFSDLLKF